MIYLQKGQSMFKGDKAEDFHLALTILDDVHVMRSRMFNLSNTTDRANQSSDRIPNYEPFVNQLRIGMRNTGYYAKPLVNRPLQSMQGKSINKDLEDLYNLRENSSITLALTMEEGHRTVFLW